MDDLDDLDDETLVAVSQQFDGSFDAFDGFSDISDSELISATQIAEGDSSSKPNRPTASCEIGDEDLLSCAETTCDRPFKAPICAADLNALAMSRFAKRTVDKSTWAVTVFGEWRAHRNRLSLQDKTGSLVYIERPFGQLTDEEFNYVIPLFISETLKKDGKRFPPGSLRDLVLSLQKFLEVS